jgi:hypothetical protein
MRKYLFNGAILSAVFGGISAFRSSKEGPRDWRTALLWVSWAATMATAVGTVIMDARERDREN